MVLQRDRGPDWLELDAGRSVSIHCMFFSSYIRACTSEGAARQLESHDLMSEASPVNIVV